MDVAGIDQCRFRFREGAGLVQDNHIDERQGALVHPAVEQDLAFEKRTCRHHLHHRNGQPQSTGAGDDEHRNGDHQRILPGQTKGYPAKKCQNAAVTCTTGA